MKDTNRIIFNTGVVYAQLIISTVIGLFIVRYVLQALGEDDFGIYMLVAGVVTLLNVLSVSMSNTSMRYMSYSLGQKDCIISLKTFNTTLYIHLLLGILVVASLEMGGWIMFEWFLNIPENRIHTAWIIYQFMVFTALSTVIGTPYEAVINSHENLLFLSILTIISNLFHLLLAILLLYYGFDKLYLYGFYLMLINFGVLVGKYVYCNFRYDECRINFKRYVDRKLFHSILSFTGWELFRSVSSIVTSQMRGVLLNAFFGVKLNAAEGLAKKVNAQVNTVSVGITRAITPQMNKSEGGGDHNRMINLTYLGVKYTTFMFALASVPLLFEMDFLLNVWLKTIPLYTVLFCQLCILSQLTDKFTWQIGNAIRAVGKIKEFQIIEGILTLSIIIISYFLLKMGQEPAIVFWVEIVISLFTSLFRLYFGKKIVGIKPTIFIKEATMPVLLPLVPSVLLPMFIVYSMQPGWTRLILVLITFIVCYSFLFYLIGIKTEERDRLKSILIILMNKVK